MRTSDEEQGTYFGMRDAQRGASGLAAAWAEENTRASIFAAFRRKETYGTSGNRIRLRFFGGFDYAGLDPEAEDLLERAYADGVPMGGDLVATDATPPRFLVWAQRDAHGAPLQRVQVVKGWYDAGFRKQANEQVYDVACSDGLDVDPDTHRCPGQRGARRPRGLLDSGRPGRCRTQGAVERSGFRSGRWRCLLLCARPREPDVPVEHLGRRAQRRTAQDGTGGDAPGTRLVIPDLVRGSVGAALVAAPRVAPASYQPPTRSAPYRS